MTNARENRRLLITAGPTHEPIDAVRFLGNRSSGRLGIALAACAADRGWRVTLLLGPVGRPVGCTDAEVLRFTTTTELRALLSDGAPHCDALVMAAAVADYRPATPPPARKLSRSDGSITLKLDPTPDLLAEAASRRRPGQLFVGFALEPADRLEETARVKLEKKGIDAIVANPLETIGSDKIDATLLWRCAPTERTGGPIAKDAFAGWLLERIESAMDR